MAGSIRDPVFWRRFSLAIRADEEAKTPGVDKDAVLFSYAFRFSLHKASIFFQSDYEQDPKYVQCLLTDELKHDRDTWIKRQEKKKRRTRLFGFLIGLSIVSFACGVAIVIWYFAKRNWLRGETDSKSG